MAFVDMLILCLIVTFIEFCNSQYNVLDTDGCVFPFRYQGKEYDKCISNERKFPWCSLMTNYEGVWKYCHDMTQTDWKCTSECELNSLPYLNCMTNAGRIMYCIDKILDLSAKTEETHCPLQYKSISEFHTFCLPPSPHVAKSGGISEEDKEMILDTHNSWRMNVSIPAANMQKIYWDDTLAKLAQKHANRCSFTHDEPELRKIPGTGTLPGQNIAMIVGPKVYDWNYILSTMFSGEKSRWKYGEGIQKSYVGRSALHYTQAIMAEISKVGCGYSECVYPDRLEKFYVCNYNSLQSAQNAKTPYKEAERFCEDCPDTCVDGKLCDCKGKICNNDGILDPNTCECICTGFWTGRNCLKPIVPKLSPIGCYIPFLYKDKLHYNCIKDENSQHSWCSKTPHFQGEVIWCDKKAKSMLLEHAKSQGLSEETENEDNNYDLEM